MNEPLDNARPSAIGLLRAASSALSGIFLVSVLLRALPPRPLDPFWQLSLATALVDMGGYALLGVVVIALAHELDPEDPAAAQQLWQCIRFSRLAALGYLLLVPLIVTALVQDHQRSERLSQRQLRQIDQQEQRLQRALQDADSREELLRVVQRVNAPALGGFLIEEGPLDRRKAAALELLRTTAGTARQQAAPGSATRLQSLLFNNLRLLLLSLVFSFAFVSVFAGRPYLPLIQPFLDRFG